MEDNNQDQVQLEEVIKPCKLWVKLKIPRDEVEAVKRADFKNQDDVVKDDDQIQIMKMEVVCNVCHKSFSSGKALGGHMRIHFQKLQPNIIINNNNKKKKLIFKPHKTNINGGGGGDEPIICIICRKDFRSMKSLYGHMRCHPDRDWRGINPPPSKKIMINNNSCCPFSSLSSAPRKIDHHTENDEEAVIDLKEYCLKGWKMTARRGRKAALIMDHESKSDQFSSSCDHEAVNYLMMLARGINNDHTSTDIDPKIDDDEEKQLNLCDLKSARKVTSPVQEYQINDNKYRWNTCGKSGGSVSNPTAPVEEEEEVDKGSSDLVEVTRDCTSDERMLDFDLNELPPSEQLDESSAGLSTLNYLTFGNCDNNHAYIFV